jgi:ABC-type nitrate/sulfonate/bicarbonate transport system substrate-binding protein
MSTMYVLGPPRLIQILILSIMLFTANIPFAAQPTKKIYLTTSSMADKILANVIAQQLGFYRDEGLELEIVLTRASVAIQGLLGGAADYINHTSVTPAIMRGTPLKVLLVDSDKPTHYFVASNKVSSVKDLVGKSVGIDDFAGNAGLLARELLVRQGLSPSQVNFRVIGPPPFRMQALMTGVVDATLLNYNLAKYAQTKGFRTLLYSGDVISEIGPSLATTQAKIKAAPDEVYNMVKATLKGYFIMYENSDEGLKFFMQAQKLNDVASARDSWQARLKRTSEASRTGMASEEAIADTLQQIKGQLETGGAPLQGKDVRSESVYDFGFAKRALAELRAEKWDSKKYRYVKKGS